jgi:hypothetical protein
MARGGRRPNTGGKREGAGRPVGSTNKISLNGMIQALQESLGDDFEKTMAQDYSRIRQDAFNTGDHTYHVALMKFLGDKLLEQQKKEVDITSDGKQLHLINIGTLETDSE